MCACGFFLFKQETAYEVRISDWSSDVCSSDLVLAAIKAGKHVVHMNAELDGTIGPILKVRADKAGVVYTFSDGDQPGVQMNLYRFVDRKSVVEGKSVSVRVELGGRRIMTTNNNIRAQRQIWR